MVHCTPKPPNCISMLFNWAYQKSPKNKNPRCLFSLSILIPNSFTSNNSSVLVCQTFLTVIQAKQAAPSFSLYSHCSRTSSRSLSLKVCPRRGERRPHNKRTLYITGKTSIFRWKETTHFHLELVQFFSLHSGLKIKAELNLIYTG